MNRLKDGTADKVWEHFGDKCIMCGGCTFVCPTCTCFNVYDLQTGRGEALAKGPGTHAFSAGLPGKPRVIIPGVTRPRDCGDVTNTSFTSTMKTDIQGAYADASVAAGVPTIVRCISVPWKLQAIAE